jgi:outer membrane immunogenic protein
MTNRWLMGAAAAALTVAGAFSAQAADLPTRKAAPAPIFIPPPFTWTGFYVGVNAGGIWSSGSRTATLFAPAAFPFPITSDFPGGLGNGNAGFIGGGQAGYNWQTGAFVMGIETDFDGTSLSKSRDLVGPTFGAAAGGFAGDFFTLHAKASLDWLGTTRARLGFVATPDNRLMFYGTGGVAYGGGSTNFSFFDNTGAVWTGNPSSSKVGWTIGAGAEYAITNNITIKGEYLYVDLGSHNFTSVGNALAQTEFPGVYGSGKIDYNASIFRAGVNYKF